MNINKTGNLNKSRRWDGSGSELILVTNDRERRRENAVALRKKKMKRADKERKGENFNQIGEK